MTNREFYKEQILDIVCTGAVVALDKRTNKPCKCSCTDCNNCIFEPWDCLNKFASWCNAEYCPFKKDEVVEVSHDGLNWRLRYFHHIENGVYFAYVNSADKDDTRFWEYCQKYGTFGGLIKETEE